LEGKESEIMQSLTRKMEAASEALEFEQAALYRDQLGSLRQILAKQFVDTHDDRDIDVIAVARDGHRACLNLVMIRGGRHLGDKSLFPSQSQEVDDAELIEAFLHQHYSDHPVPPVVVCDEIEDILGMADLLTERAQKSVQVLTRVRGERRRWLDMARQNAKLALMQRVAQDAIHGGRLAALQEALGLAPGVTRTECFDISHTQGEATVASCVVFENGEAVKRDYRRYNIEGIQGGDDYAAMRQVLTRRYQKVAEGEGKRPDLILIDGGRGQLNVAVEVLNDLGLSDIPLVSVAKGEGRRPGLEELIFPDRPEGLRLPVENPGFHLIQHIRDEAHRFAISGHRARRGRARTVSRLDEIEGVGAKRKSRLIAQFGSVKGLEGASLEDIAAVEGIGPALALKIYRELHAGLSDN
jgi:excinuclease ABC subunit C